MYVYVKLICEQELYTFFFYELNLHNGPLGALAPAHDGYKYTKMYKLKSTISLNFCKYKMHIMLVHKHIIQH